MKEFIVLLVILIPVTVKLNETLVFQTNWFVLTGHICIVKSILLFIYTHHKVCRMKNL